jgi:hypothetical protein
LFIWRFAAFSSTLLKNCADLSIPTSCGKSPVFKQSFDFGVGAMTDSGIFLQTNFRMVCLKNLELESASVYLGFEVKNKRYSAYCQKAIASLIL